MTRDHTWRQLEALLRNAREQIVLLAPFIKADVFEAVLGVVPASVTKITCVTRWSPAEVAAGASDPEIIVAADRDSRIRLVLNPLLHAKIYIADDRCLTGSANLTNRALGRGVQGNVEVLVDTSPTHPEIARAVALAMRDAQPATMDLARQVRQQADSLARLYGDADFLSSVSKSDMSSWLPETRDPSRLYPVYSASHVDYQSDVLDGVMRDLMHLGIPAGMNESDFRKAVAQRLRSIPAVKDFTLDGQMASTVLEERIIETAGCSETEARRTAVVIGEWFQYFEQASLLPLGQWELREALRRSD